MSRRCMFADLCNQSFSTQGSLKRYRESVHRQSAGFLWHATETLEDAPTSGVTRRFSGLSDRHDSWLTITTTTTTTTAQETRRDASVRRLRQDLSYSENAEEAPRDRSLSIWRLLLSSVRRRFYWRDHLKERHIRNHVDEECEARASYPCPICQKRFHYIRTPEDPPSHQNHPHHDIHHDHDNHQRHIHHDIHQPCIETKFKLPQFILSQTSKESCPFIVYIVIDYSHEQTVQFVTRNIAVKERRNEKMSQRPHFLPKTRMGS